MYRAVSYVSPLGGLTIAAKEQCITALVLDGQKYREQHVTAGTVVCAREQADGILAEACEWLDAYFAGEKPALTRLPLAPEGSAFRQRVWRELMKIPYGETTTYGAIAGALGSCARAVGNAVGHNPISIIIPCHRVVGADGSLTGYAGGIENKIKMLRLEGAEIKI